MPLITAAEVAQLAGAPESDPILVRLTDAANAFVSGETGWSFDRAERVEYPQGYGVDYLFLGESPIETVTEVRVDRARKFGADTVIPIEQFSWNSQFKDTRLWWNGRRFPDAARMVMVTYTAGFWPAGDTDPLHVPQPPEDLRAELIADTAAAYREDPQLTRWQSVSQGDHSYTRFAEYASPRLVRLIQRYMKR